MQKIDVDFFTVFIAAILQWILVLFWYSPLFNRRLSSKHSFDSYKTFRFQVSSFFIGLVLAFFLAIIEGFVGVMSTSDGILVGVFMAFGFIATTQMAPVFRNALSWKTYCFDMGFWFVSFIVMGGILAI